MNYYNEFDAGAAAWLRVLILRGLIPYGVVDERSITEIRPHELEGYTQCHFFAGIGGWPLALQLAGWPADRPVWTGSCPCQPYSTAGAQRGHDDERDLWPAFERLIAQCSPNTVFGEQVEGAIRHGWLDRVCADLEKKNYAVGHVVLGAHSVGAPHIRQRLFWLAHHHREPSGQRGAYVDGWGPGGDAQPRAGFGRRGDDSGLGDSNGAGSLKGSGAAETDGYRSAAFADGRRGDDSRLAHSGGTGRPQLAGQRVEPTGLAAPCGTDCGVPDADSKPRRRKAGDAERSTGNAPGGQWPAEPGRYVGADWGDNWIACADGKARRIEPGLAPLAHGVPARVVRLRGYGNAIVPELGAAFVRAYLEAEVTL